MGTPFCTIAPQYPGEAGKSGRSSSWVLSGSGTLADLDLDFVNNRGWQGLLASPASLVTCTRAISGTGHVYDYAEDANGVWYPFSANTPRITNKGLLVEESRTNSLRTSNPYETASPLTYGAAATDDVELLTNWDFSSALSTGWTVTNNGGSSFARVGTKNVTLTYDGTNNTYLDQSFTTVVGQRYTVRVAFASVTTMTPRLDVGTAQGGTQFLSGSSLLAGPRYFTFIATTTTTWVRIKGAGSAGSAQLYTASVKVGGIPSLGGTGTWSIVDSDVDDLDIYARVTDVGIASNGLPYLRFRVSGTVGAGNGAIALRFEQANQIVANNSTLAVWSGGVIARLVSGSTSGFSNVQFAIYPTNGSSTLSGGQYSANLTLGSAFETNVGSTNFSNASTTNVYSVILFNINAGQTVDIEIDIIPLNLELGEFATSPILTTTTAVTRNADVVTVTTPPTFGSEYSLFAQATPVAPTTYTSEGGVVAITNSGAATNNRFGLFRNSSNGNSAWVFVGNGSSAINGSITGVTNPWAQNASGKIAAAAAANDLYANFNNSGAGHAIATATVLTSPDTIRIGQKESASTSWFNGYISRVAVWASKRVSNAEIKRITT